MSEREYTQEELEEAVKWLNAELAGAGMPKEQGRRIAIVLSHLDACDKFIEKLGWKLPE